MPFDLISLKQAIDNGRIEWRKHTLQRMAERTVLREEAIQVLLSGEVIRDYQDDRLFPSALVFDWIANRPIHVVVSYDRVTDVVYIITVYEPSIEVFEEDFKTRKK